MINENYKLDFKLLNYCEKIKIILKLMILKKTKSLDVKKPLRYWFLFVWNKTYLFGWYGRKY